MSVEKIFPIRPNAFDALVKSSFFTTLFTGFSIAIYLYKFEANTLQFLGAWLGLSFFSGLVIFPNVMFFGYLVKNICQSRERAVSYYTVSLFLSAIISILAYAFTELLRGMNSLFFSLFFVFGVPCALISTAFFLKFYYGSFFRILAQYPAATDESHKPSNKTSGTL